jgi:hypothetical protein
MKIQGVMRMSNRAVVVFTRRNAPSSVKIGNFQLQIQRGGMGYIRNDASELAANSCMGTNHIDTVTDI